MSCELWAMGFECKDRPVRRCHLYCNNNTITLRLLVKTRNLSAEGMTTARLPNTDR